MNFTLNYEYDPLRSSKRDNRARQKKEHISYYRQALLIDVQSIAYNVTDCPSIFQKIKVNALNATFEPNLSNKSAYASKLKL